MCYGDPDEGYYYKEWLEEQDRQAEDEYLRERIMELERGEER